MFLINLDDEPAPASGYLRPLPPDIRPDFRVNLFNSSVNGWQVVYAEYLDSVPINPNQAIVSIAAQNLNLPIVPKLFNHLALPDNFAKHEKHPSVASEYQVNRLFPVPDRVIAEHRTLFGLRSVMQKLTRTQDFPIVRNEG